MWLINRQNTTSVEHFLSNGFVGPIKIFNNEECCKIEKYFNEMSTPEPADWYKGYAINDHFIYRLAIRPDILKILKLLLGDNIILWGARLITKKPGEIHAWHTDIECAQNSGSYATVWIGLSNCSKKTSLKLMSGSHKFNKNIQEIRYEKNLSRKKITDKEITDIAGEFDKTSRLITPKIKDGEAIIFHGKIWHGSFNSSRETRKALLFQYASSDSIIRMPDFKQLDWPFIFKDYPLPPVLLISGTAPAGINRLVPPPAPGTCN